MSFDKFLSDAVGAARERADDGVTDGAHTRMRIRESLAQRGVVQRKRFTLIAAVIASLFGSTAFAYWAGWRPPWSEPVAAVAPAPAPAVEDQAPRKRGPAQRAPAVEPAAPLSEQQVAVDETAAPSAASEARVASEPSATASSGTSASPLIASEPSATASSGTSVSPRVASEPSANASSGANASRANASSRASASPGANASSSGANASSGANVTSSRASASPHVASEPSAAPGAGASPRVASEPSAAPGAGASPRVASEPSASRVASEPRVANDAPPVTARSAPSSSAPSSPTASSPASSTSPAPSGPTPSSVARPSVPSVNERAQPDPELAAYRTAHDLHFKGNDARAALAAWDAYLARFPGGKLAPEARYDRALVLVKLARWAEARAALAPFANAKAGAYRQREAAEILAAIKDR